VSQTPIPTLNYELELYAQGYQIIAGVDEAGRGSIFGPVCVGMVILPLDKPEELLPKLIDVRDSKKISRPKVYRLAEVVKSVARAWGVGVSTAQDVDQFGIMPAIRKAAEYALQQMEEAFNLSVDYLLTDSALPCPTGFPSDRQLSIVKGDALSLSIACGAILAKQHHDALVRDIARNYEEDYQLINNVGYGTKAHKEAIMKLGYTPHHRRTFRLKGVSFD